jgi:hypothetical protein
MNFTYWTILLLGLKYITAGIVLSIFCWLIVNAIIKEYNISKANIIAK